MQCFQGKSVYKGIVMGPVAVLKKNDYQVKRARIEDPEAEVKRVEEAVEVSKKQLGRLYDKAVREVGEASAAIFEVHQMMLEDEDYLESMENMIRTELVNAEYAAAATGDNFAEMFAAMDDEYMKARSADVKDISERLVRNLSGEGDNDLSSMEPSVIVADDLSPSETVQMDKSKVLSVCDCAWIYQFSYCDSCANDEYSGINRRPDGFKWSENRHDGRCRRFFRSGYL